MSAPLHGELEGGLGNAGRALPRDLAHGKRKVGRRHEFTRAEKHRAVGIKAFSVLAHDHQIDRLAAAWRKPGTRARRADVGVEIEPLAQVAGRVEPALRAGGYSLCDTGPSSTPCAALAFSNTAWGNVVPAARCAAQPMAAVSKAGPARICGRGTQHCKRRGDDLRPDAVAFQHQNVEGTAVLRRHAHLRRYLASAI